MQKTLQNRRAGFAFCVLLAITTMPLLSQVDEQYLAGCAYYLKGDYFRAAESFSLAITRNNADEQLYIKRGESLLKTNAIEQATADFNEANLINPGVADLCLSRAYAIANDNNNAIRFLKSHLASSFRLSEDSIKKDPAFDRLQMTTEWHSLWQKDWYTEAEKAVLEANYYAARKQFDRAMTVVDEELMKSSGNPTLTFLRGRISLQQGLYAAAIADFSAALNQDKTFPSGYSLRGLAYLKAERFKDAVSDLNKALRVEPGNFTLYLQRAEAYAGMKTWGSAIKDIQFYLKYFENDLQARYLCGKYYFNSEDYINALKYFNINLKEDPNNSLYYKARGETYLKTSTYRYAISDLSMALDLDPNDAETWMNLGVAKIKLGERENGCSDLERAKKMGNLEAVKYLMDYCQ